MRTKLIVVIVALVVGAALLFAADDARAQKSKDLVAKFIAYYQKAGAETAFKAASDPKGSFVDGELYVFVIDTTGNTLAHGGNAALIGKNNLELKDPNGVYFFKEFIALAKAKGEGWSNYKWPNPVSKKVETKTTFVKMIPGTDYIVGCGYYTGS